MDTSCLARVGRAFVVVAGLLSAAGPVFAQARAGDEANPRPSPLAATWQRFDEALATRLPGADDAAGHWMLGRLSSLEPVVQSREFAAAFVRDPRERLFVASLADICMRPVQPTLLECGERDIVGHWVSRESDNAVPWLLQAEKARRRNNIESLVENLDGAARANRFDDHSGRGGQLFATRILTFAAPADRAAAWLGGDRLASGVLGAPMEALEQVCSAGSRGLDERIGRGCQRLAALMIERATAFTHRRAGAQVAFASAAGEPARASARRAETTVIAQQERCRVAWSEVERLAAGNDADRARALPLAQRFVTERAAGGEVAGCETLPGSLAPG